MKALTIKDRGLWTVFMNKKVHAFERMPADRGQGTRNRKFLIEIVLAILVLTSYWGVTGNDFVNYDDPAYVTENRHVQKGLRTEEIQWAFTASYISNWHPLTWVSLMLDSGLYGRHPGGYHWTNVILHLLGVMILFIALERMTGRLWCSGLTAALFSVHPLHVESVAWVAERKDVLCGLFWMLGLWGYVRYAERPGLIRYGWVILFFVAGFLSKPMVVTFPFLLLLLDWWPLGRIDFSSLHPSSGNVASSSGWRENGANGVRFLRASISSLVREKIPMLILSAAGSVITFHVQKEGEAVASLHNLPLADRLANAVVSYAQYLVKMLFPFNLAVFYPHPGAWPMREVILSFGLLLSISWLAFRQVRRRPYLTVGWLWYLGTLVPVIGLVQVGAQAMADRYTYLPLIGIYIMASWGMADLLADSSRRRMIGWGVSGVMLAVLVFMTQTQVGYWKDSTALFEHALRVTENNYEAHNNLGRALAFREKYPEAMVHYREAIRINSNFMPAHNNLGIALMEQGRFEEAMAAFAEALEIKPGDGTIHMNRGELFVRKGMMTEAIVEYRLAMKKKPYDPLLHNNLGVALTRQGEGSEAMRAYREAIRLDPEYAGAHANLAMLLAGQGEIDEAISHFRRAIRYRPDYANAHYQISLLLKHKGLAKEAANYLREAKRLNPDIDNVYGKQAEKKLDTQKH